MQKRLKKLYFFILVPIKAVYLFTVSTLSLLFLFLSFIYVFSFELILEHEIFKANPSDIENIMTWKPHDNSIIFDKDGSVISEQFNEYHVYLPFDKIPKKIINSILAIEDRKFWQHRGIDIYSIFRAAGSYLNPKKGSIKQGASTITQQIVKNLELTREKTLTRKIREIVLSIYLEKHLSKEKILEIYCNSMFLGNGSYGIGAAAKRFFNKSIDELDTHETALIAGLFQSPGKYNPTRHPERAKKRQLKVLFAMKEANFIDNKTYDIYKNKELNYQAYESSYGKTAPYFVDYVIDESQKILSQLDIKLKDSGVKIYTTLDMKLNDMAQLSFKESNNIFKNLEKSIIFDNRKEDTLAQDVEGAMLVLDRRTGKILSMIGGRDYNYSQYNRTVSALRAPGSVFKSITYALGMKKGHDWNKQYYVSPITIGNYRPRTQYSKLFTETTMLHSFYKSINSTAVVLGNDLGVKNVVKFAQTLGIETLLKDEASTLLGGSEVTMLDMARVYSTFGNDGLLTPLQSITRIEDRNGEVLYRAPDIKTTQKRVLDRRSNQLIVEGLKSVIRHGTGYRARHLSGRAAGKTGTSNKSKDNWFCGFTDDLVVAVWMGNDDQNSFRGNISASNTATPLWASFVKKSIKYLNTRRLRRPSILSSVKVHPRYGHRDNTGVSMYFSPGKVPVEEKSDLFLLEQGEQLRIGMNEL